jgi:hypothetical protein
MSIPANHLAPSPWTINFVHIRLAKRVLIANFRSFWAH